MKLARLRLYMNEGVDKMFNQLSRRQQVIYLTESGLVPYSERYRLLVDPQKQKIKIPSKAYAQWQDFLSQYPPTYFQEVYQKEGVVPLVVGDPAYPKALLETHKPALVLFCQGDITLFKRLSLSVVGSRKMTTYGQEALKKLLPPLVEKLVIVSGLANGIDCLSHQIAIERQGKTIAVIGTGLGQVYPDQNASLQGQIARDHLLVSPLPYHAGAKRWHFPYRNEIIAGLSAACLVVEAGQKSGSLITANYALQANRDVFAVPGPITQPLSRGTNELIQAGAKLILTSQDILEEYSHLL
ncbi:DNA-protecting protein DprA [Aerococcus sanguinicola]|uniref:DNA-protecting protein DprA n=2 Tax=Aerococcaceae TaxID=186827 RepID=A0A5N1GPC5_9LACT|nr:DNA-protecting protein DprA [Aerococcus sanguinicola]